MTITIQATCSNPAINPNRLKKPVCGSTSFINSINSIQNNNNSIWKKLVSFINRIRFTSDRKANIKFIERHFKLPDLYKKEIFHDKNTTSIMIKKEYEKFIPSENEIKTGEDLDLKNQKNGFIYDSKLSKQFNLDLHRMDYFLYTPYRQPEPYKLVDAKLLTAEFGRRNAQFISQFAHQGFTADPLIALQPLIKDDNYVISNSMMDNEQSIKRPLIFIEKTMQGHCIVTAKKTIRLIKKEDGEILKGMTVSIIRKTFFIKGKDGLFLENHDKKDQLLFVITKKPTTTNPS
ncbi:hypothetical protein AB7179_06775 [Providencia manganoxydans]|uniref:Uncharacterized protein n=1 Tax=Providencia manganoxydans TaxID=2923283 RepID=A0ABX7AD39_9GAMM|nr:hypothetical protein [Providencia manganoxydans]MDX4946304.1 hypothetical protein [Providencia manganoxydans]QQO61882.1 hypothetical protein JI723_16815 [Providencia manganoxydans]HEF8773752.1 hypothetical protein [Providencia stuartii]